MSKYIGTPVVSLVTDTVDVTGDITTTDATPEVIIVNDTHEDTDGGREGKVTFKGQQSGGEETTLAQIQASHDGTSDDEKGDLIFKTNDGSDGASPTTRMTIDSAGDVGIGAAPSYGRLHIFDDNSDIAMDANGSGQLHIDGNGYAFGVALNANGAQIYTNSASRDIIFGVNETEIMRITDGKVGIGIDNPTHELVLFGTGAGNATMQIEGEGGADPQINFLTNNTTHWSVGVDDSRFDTFKINNHSAVGTTNEYLCVDTSGKVGINTDSMSNNLTLEGASYTLFGMKRTTGVTTGTGEFAMHVETNSQVSISYDDEGSVVFGTAGTPTTAAGFSEKMRLDASGNLLVGTSSTTTQTDGFRVFPTGSDGGTLVECFNDDNGTALIVGRGGGNGEAVRFYRGSTEVGSIDVTTTSTSYGTSSDYRLKENVTDVTDGITRVKQLSPKRFNFIADADTTVDGFLAHEAQAVVPEAVTGTHNGMMDQTYVVSAATGDIYTPATEEAEEVIHSSNVEQPETLEEGQRWRQTTAAEMGTRSVPEYQGIDQAKLVPLLTAALQEAIAKIETLETKVAALEGE
jgi:hypothetical protein